MNDEKARYQFDSTKSFKHWSEIPETERIERLRQEVQQLKHQLNWRYHDLSLAVQNAMSIAQNHEHAARGHVVMPASMTQSGVNLVQGKSVQDPLA